MVFLYPKFKNCTGAVERPAQNGVSFNYAGKNKKSLATTPGDDKIFPHTSETLSGTAFKNIISQPTENATKKFSFGGIKALTADEDARKKAVIMEREGKSTDEIRKETGWFRGYDGMWRFEIDDSELEILNLEADKTTLGELIEHEKLFEAYPGFRHISVIFKDISLGGMTNSKKGIIINKKLRNDTQALKQTLAHEIQHMIQSEEGFANGASEEYWNERLKDGYDSRTVS